MSRGRGAADVDPAGRPIAAPTYPNRCGRAYSTASSRQLNAIARHRTSRPDDGGTAL